MMNTLRGILAGVALVLAAWLGWHFGSRGLEEARAELKRLDEAGKAALAEQQKAQDKLKNDLGELGRQHEAKLEALTKGFDEQRKGLEASLSSAQARLKATVGQRDQTLSDLKDVRARLDALPKDATAAQREVLVKEEVRLVETERKLSKLELGLECLDAPVPLRETLALDVAPAGTSKP